MAQRIRQRLRATLDFEIAAEQAPAFGREPPLDADAKAPDGGNRGHPECEAGQHDAEAANAGAQLAAGEAERRAQETRSATRPSTILIVRSQRAASAGSWVMSRRVVP